MIERGYTDADIGRHYSMSYNKIAALRRKWGISCAARIAPQSKFHDDEHAIRALVTVKAEVAFRGVRFEDSPVAIRAQAGGYGQLPPRASFGTRGGSMIQLENC